MIQSTQCLKKFSNQTSFEARLQNCEKRLLASSCLSAWKNSGATGRIFIKFDIGLFFESLLRKSNFH